MDEAPLWWLTRNILSVALDTSKPCGWSSLPAGNPTISALTGSLAAPGLGSSIHTPPLADDSGPCSKIPNKSPLVTNTTAWRPTARSSEPTSPLPTPTREQVSSLKVYPGGRLMDSLHICTFFTITAITRIRITNANFHAMARCKNGTNMDPESLKCNFRVYG